MTTIFKLGDFVKWVENSSWQAHQNEIIFRLDVIVKRNEQYPFIYDQAFDEYRLDGLLLYLEKNGQWMVVQSPKKISVKWIYNDNVGGGFPSLFTFDTL
tara:strand:- start:1540 stop:1836 length:297 start_codon:yes stop_codon:yes gene_type:complete